MGPHRSDPWLWALAAAWAGVVAAGFAAWARHESTPGPDGPAAGRGTGPGIVLFAHPHCPCTRDGIDEFARAAAGATGVTARVVFVLPAGVPAGWEEGESWRAAARLPGVVRDRDPGGAGARAAGARTSGCAVATDAAGRVVFRGGFTPGRGRTGDCPGRRALAAVADGGEPEVREAPVFGCPLFGPDG